VSCRRAGPYRRISALDPATPSLFPARIPYSILDSLLHLPPGSALQRRYFGLLVRAAAVEGTGLRRGDRLIVAPAAEPAAGALTVCRRNHALELFSVRIDAYGQPSLTSPDPELLPLSLTAATVVGTAVAAIRRVQSDWFVGYPPAYCFTEAVSSSSYRLDTAQLEYLRCEVDEIQRGADVARALHPEEARVLRSCAARLSTLTGCLEVIHDERLYRAILVEIDAALLRLRDILAGRPRWALLRSHLRVLRAS